MTPPLQPTVTAHDVARIQEHLQPGGLYSSAELYEMYVRLVRAEKRPPAHTTTFGHALRSAGWVRHRVRTYGEGNRTEVASWFVPGGSHESEERRNLKTVLQALGQNVWREEKIWAKYKEFAEEHDWPMPSGRPALAMILTRAGFARIRQDGQWSRYIDPKIVDAL